MSSTFLIFTCDECSFRGTSLSLSGRYLWTNGKGVFEFQIQAGFCRDCGKIVATEVFPDRNHSYTEEDPSPEDDFNARIKKAIQKMRSDRDAKQRANPKSRKVLEDVLELKRKPVCLECGGEDVIAIEVPEGAGGDTPIDLGVLHDGCAGKLKVQGSGRVRIGIRPTTKIFDIQGKIVANLYDDI